MVKNRLLFILVLLTNTAFAQQTLEFFIAEANKNSPVLSEYRHLQKVNELQKELNIAENSAFHLSLSGDYLFAPFFNNHGDLVSSNPSPEAIGYDAAITDGGLYSAQINLERNIFNGRLMGVLEQQADIQDKTFGYNFSLQKHGLEKDVTDQYLTVSHSFQLMNLMDEVISNLQEQLKLSSEMVKRGLAKSQDYLLLKIELDNQNINLNNAGNTYRNDLFKLYSLCGISDTSIVEIIPLNLAIKHFAGSSYFIQKYNIDSLNLVSQQELFETKYQPQIKLFANAGLNAIELNQIQHRFGMSVGLSLSFAILDGNQRSLTRQQNKINRQSVAEYRHYALNNIDLHRRNLKSRIRVLQKNIQNIESQVIDYRQLLEISVGQLQLGNISMIDYLTLLRDFIDLKERQINTNTDYQTEINNYNYWNW